MEIQTNTHARLLVFVISGFTLLGLLPGSVFAEASTSTPATAQTPAAVINPYPTEHLPGNAVVGDFVVGPGKVELTIKPGESKTVDLTVTNRTGVTREFKLGVEDFTGSNDPKKPVVLLGEDRGPYTLKDYVSYATDHFTLKNSERARIPVTITIPKDAQPGGRYGSVLVSTNMRSQRTESADAAAPTSVIESRVGTLFFITIPGDVKTEGALTDFTIIPKKPWYESGPLDFGLTYQNTGSIHTNPYGEIRITNMLGEEVGFINVDPWFSLPNSIRLREVLWDRTFLFGRYTATAEINRGYDDKIDTKVIHFWVLPWKIVLGAFVGLFIVFYLIRTFFKRFEFRRKG